MIITITGKPCSGKGTVGKLFAEKYNFEYMCTGDMFREYTKKLGYSSILEFQQKYPDITSVDKEIDNQTTEIGKKRINDNIIFDSRLAWNFIPESFKVFIDVDWNIAAERLLQTNRNTEKVSSLQEAELALKNRWQEENDRYIKLYKTNNTNPNNYNLVVSSTDKTPEELCEIIYNEYQKFMHQA